MTYILQLIKSEIRLKFSVTIIRKSLPCNLNSWLLISVASQKNVLPKIVLLNKCYPCPAMRGKKKKKNGTWLSSICR